MAVYKEINRADGSGVTTFYRISDILDTAETDDKESQSVVIDYNQAQNKPSINGVALVGNKTSEDLGLQPAGDYITNNEADEKFIDEDELEAKNYVNQAELQDAIAHIEHFHREIVEALPVTGMDNVLYMVRKGGTGEDIYNEYIWVGLSNSENGYEFLGTTATDLTDYYKKSQVDAALATKVDKEGGKGLSEENYTLAEKTKLAGLKNYDDTEIQAEVSGLNTDINNLKKSNITISNTLAELKPDVDSNTAAVSTIYDLLDNKMTAIRLVEQGDGWVWMNLEGSRLTYAQASAALGHENCMLFIEQLENDGKVIPAEYKSEGNYINVIFKDLDSLVHIMTCGEDDVVVTKDVTTTNGQVDFTVEDEAIGYTTKMTALYGKSTQATSTNPVSPSPDYPSPIESITEISVTVTGKNLFDKDNATTQVGYFRPDGAINNGGDSTITTSYTSILPNTDMTISGLTLEWICFYDKNKNFIERVSGTLKTFNKNAYYIRIQAPTNVFDLSKIQLEKGQATDYEQYKSNSLTIDLQGNELCSLPNGVKDELVIENGRAKIIKRIGKVVLDGSESWSLSSGTNRYSFWLKNSTISNMVNAWNYKLSNYFKYENKAYSTASIPCIAENTAGANPMLIFNTDGSQGTTIPQWKTWLSTHNTQLDYELAAPIEIEITDPTLLAQLNALEQITQYKHTYITITGDDLTPEADFTYINNVVINNTDSVLGKDTYWNDEVPTQQDLPSKAQEGEIRIVQDTEDVYIYNGTKWVPFDKNSEVDLSNYLTKDNTTPWVPTGPFNPSTKKYVDDSVGGIHVPTKTSQLQNDSDFVIKTTNELTNYYTKNNTYTKNEVDALVAGGSGASDYTALSNKPSLDTTSGVSLNPLKEEINGEISLHKIAKTGNYKDLLYKPIIPITFTDNMESDYSISKLPGWQVDLLQKMIDEYVKDNKSINNYILKADGIMFLENYAIGDLNNKYSTEGKNTRLYTFKKCGPYGSIPHAFQFVGPTSLSYTKYPESGYGVIDISNKGILIYCDNNYRVTEVCQRYKLYDEAEKNTSVSIEVVPTNLSRATAFIATKDHQPATKKYVDDSINGIVESGSNENGNWIKYSDGTMICTKKHTGTANVNVALGSIFYNGYYAMAGDLPQNFIEAPYYYATNVESEWEIWGLQTKPVTTSKWTTRVDLMSATSQSDKPITITMIAIGKWK